MKKINFNFNLGVRIRDQRERLGYSREKLAELASMSDGYLGEIERGVKGISSLLLYKIAISLGVTMDYLVTSEQDSNIIISREIESILNFLQICEKEDLKLIEKIIKAIVTGD